MSGTCGLGFPAMLGHLDPFGPLTMILLEWLAQFLASPTLGSFCLAFRQVRTPLHPIVTIQIAVHEGQTKSFASEALVLCVPSSLRLRRRIAGRLSLLLGNLLHAT